MTIHSTAIIAQGAEIESSVEIGPYAVIGPNVKIAAGTSIGAHAVIDGRTAIGSNCRIFAGASIGLEPQDLKYNNEPSGVIIGDDVTVREYCTIHRATGDRTTVVGDGSFLMNYVHIAHDCKVGKGVILANNTCFAGHVTVGDYAVFAGYTVIHQFVRVGRCVMVSGMTGSRLDIPPYSMTDGRPAAVRGVNVIGMRRQKLGPQVRSAIKQSYRLLYKSGLNNSQAIARIEEELEPFEEVKEICQFFKDSKRGVISLFGATDAESGALEELPVEAI